MAFGLRGILAVTWLLSAGVLAAEPDVAVEKRLVETVPGGQVDWTQWVVRTIGHQGPEDPSFGKVGDRVLAQQAAEVLARENLMQAVGFLRLKEDVTVGEVIDRHPMVRSEIREMIRNAAVFRQTYLSDGTVTVSMRLPLSGGFSQLLLPEDVRQIDPIKAVPEKRKAGRASATGESGADSPDGPLGGYAGLIVDATGMQLLPAMVVRIVGENRKEVYGPAFASREFAVKNGMVRYVRDLAAAQDALRITGKPMFVKGLRTRGTSRTDIVISNADAARLHGSSAHISFLRQCRVVIVTGE